LEWNHFNRALYTEGLLKGNIQNLIPIGGGICIMFITLPLSKTKIRHMEKAVSIYNQSLRDKK